jgi:hypothetical protein
MPNRYFDVEGMRKWLDRYDRLDIFQAFRQNEIRKFGCTLAELRRHDYDNRMKGIPARRAA